MLLILPISCPYCHGCIHAYDTERAAIILNLDRANNQPCPHLCFGYYLSRSVDFHWLHPAYPQDVHTLEFFIHAVHVPSSLPPLKSDYQVEEKDVDLRQCNHLTLHTCTLWAKDIQAFAAELRPILYPINN